MRPIAVGAYGRPLWLTNPTFASSAEISRRDRRPPFGDRDFGVHPKTTDITVETSYVALHLCIELAAVLAHELTVEKNPT